MVCQVRCDEMDGGPKIDDLMLAVTRDVSAADFEAAYDTIGRRNARIGGGGKYGSTVLHAAVICGNFPLAEYLVKQYGKSLVNIGDEHGRTPLHSAAVLDDQELALKFVRFFADCGAFFDICGTDVRAPETALMAARDKGNKLVENYLREKGAYEPSAESRAAPTNERSTKRARSTEDDDACCEHYSEGSQEKK